MTSLNSIRISIRTQRRSTKGMHRQSDFVLSLSYCVLCVPHSIRSFKFWINAYGMLLFRRNNIYYQMHNSVLSLVSLHTFSYFLVPHLINLKCGLRCVHDKHALALIRIDERKKEKHCCVKLDQRTWLLVLYFSRQTHRDKWATWY